MVKKILSWVLLVMLLAYVVTAAIWANGEAQKNLCQGINIDIVKTMSVDSVSKKGVMTEISKYPEKIVGQPISLINSKAIEQHLKENPQFENANCSFTTDGYLQVRVVPMVPELRVFEDSASYYINKDGKRMVSKASYFVDVPIVSGKFTNNFTAKDVLPVIRFISTDPALGPLIGMVRAEDSDNILLIPRIHGHVINFGDTNRLEEKKRALLAMYKKVLPYKGWNEYDTISVKFKGQVVATRRLKPVRPQALGSFEETDMEEATLPDIQDREN